MALLVLILAGSLGLLLFLFREGVSLFGVRGSSMEPTLSDGDSVLLRQAREIERGQLIFFRQPTSWPGRGDQHLLVKRVAAVPGDTLSFDGVRLFVNGVALPQPEDFKCSGPAGFTLTLSPSQVFAVGDNAGASEDSRSVFCSGNPLGGFIERRQVVDYGTVIFKF